MEVYDPQQSTLHCPTCNLHFNHPQNHKDHYRTDFHRYNLKRKMVKLPPVTQQQFQLKIVDNPRENQQKYQCKQCGKQFGSAGTLTQHATSKGHNPQAQSGIKSQQTANKKQQVKAVFVKNCKKCLFCSKISCSIVQNQSHMSVSHSFFIGSRDYCINIEGLLQYLQQKIQVGNMCITCENKGAHDFQSAEAVRRHMVDRGHTFMRTQNGFQQYEKYYDFSSLFRQKLKEQQIVIPGIEYQEVKVLVEDKEEGSEGDWEDASEDDNQSENGEWQSIQEEDEDESNNKEEGKVEGKGEQKNRRKVKTYRIMKPTLTSNDELLLPNGKTLGHRKYRYLYKQNVRIQPWYSTLKSIGYGFTQQSSALVDGKLWGKMMRAEQKKWRELVGRERKMALRVGMNNNGLIKHFRCQNSL